MRIDLHLHSTASDGSLSPSALMWAARSAGLQVVALTDHDTTAGIKEAEATAAGELHVIRGIEISTTHEGAELHMLGYFIDPDDPELVTYAVEAAEGRRARMRRMLERLADLGMRVTYDEVVAAAGPASAVIGRPHLARALVQRGYAHSFSDAFDRYIGDQGPAFEPTSLLQPCGAIELIHDAGGIAVWAHPRATVLQRDLPHFVRWGLDGIECFRPRCSSEECLALESAAKANGLLVTGGSDWHGSWHGRLGEFSMSHDEVAAFLERGGI